MSLKQVQNTEKHIGIYHLQFENDQQNVNSFKVDQSQQQQSIIQNNSLPKKYKYNDQSILSQLVQQYQIGEYQQNEDITIKKKTLKDKIKMCRNQKKNIFPQTQNEFIDELFNNQKIKYDYSSKKYKIYKEFLQRNYQLLNYLDSGGQADVFDGYFQNDQGMQEESVFKIYFDATDEDFQKEKEIIKSFEKPINVVKIIDSFQIEQFYILVIEKCQYSLKKELKLFKERQIIFSFDNLLQIIFDLFDGIILLRIYQILHLDIKPANILKSKAGNYCYSDFGTSFKVKKNNQVEIKYITKMFAAPEQINKQESIDFQSDIYSLGITLSQVIDIFKDVNYDYLSNTIMIRETIQRFEKIINESMIVTKSQQRLQCKDLHHKFLQSFQGDAQLQFSTNYSNKIKQMNFLYLYDYNKDIQYFLQLKLFYSQQNLFSHFIKNGKFQKYDCNDSKEKEQSDLQSKQNDLDLSEWQKVRKYAPQESYPDIAESLNYVGSCHINLGEYEDGLKYYLESLKIRKQIFQGNHPSTATSLDNVGSCYMNLNENQKGLTYLLQSLEMRKQIFSGNYPDIANSLTNIGLCYIKLGDYQNSLKYLLESNNMIKQMNQENNLLTASSFYNLGLCYKSCGDYQNGLKHSLESLEIRKQFFQKINLDIADSLNNIGLCYMNLDQNEFALEYLFESLEIKKQLFQIAHPSITESLRNIQSCYSKNGDYDNSWKYSFEAIQMNLQDKFQKPIKLRQFPLLYGFFAIGD